MPKLSAGIIAYRKNADNKLQVLLVHLGGPLWKNKDEGAWSIPKGEYAEDEDALMAAKREFEEETGNKLQAEIFIALEPVKIRSGKVISAWAAADDFDKPFIKSNLFEMEWPPLSGKKQLFPETDKAEWFTIEEAMLKISAGQAALIEQVAGMRL